jgi:hypothetical protein
LKTHLTHAQTLKDRTKCTGNDGAGSRCQRTATQKGLCDTHQACTLACRGTQCDSGKPPTSKKRGLCQPCLDAFELIVNAQAARFTPAEPPTKRRKQG